MTTWRRPLILGASPLTVAALVLAATGCGADTIDADDTTAGTFASDTGDGATAREPAVVRAGVPPVVAVAAQRCTRPVADRGLGVVVGDDLVATAAHTVEGELRELTVDGLDATVVALDPRTDLALLSVVVDAAPAVLGTGGAGGETGPAWLHEADARTPVEIVRTAPLIVDDATTGRRHRRQVHTFTPGVEAGTSGAPLTSLDGHVIGIVVLDGRGDGVAYAVTSVELHDLLDDDRGGGPGTPPACAS